MKRIFITSALAIAMVSGINAQNKELKSNSTEVSTNGTEDDINETGIVGISNWESFNKLSREMYTLKGADYFTTITMMRRMQPTVAKLQATMPAWMNTEEIIEDVDDFIKDYNELVGDTTADDKEFRENLEEISEQYEDLREEAQEVFVEYRKTVTSGDEEWIEVLEEGRIVKKNVKDGREDNKKEEIKKLKKIPDGNNNL